MLSRKACSCWLQLVSSLPLGMVSSEVWTLVIGSEECEQISWLKRCKLRRVSCELVMYFKAYCWSNLVGCRFNKRRSRSQILRKPSRG